MSVEEKRTLTKQLNELLGFDDGVEDVLEHLLSIESGEDLLDHLSQFLGQEGDKVKSFVDEVGKFQRGEPLSGNSMSTNEPVKQPAITSREKQYNNQRSTTVVAKGTTTSTQKQKPRDNANQKPLVKKAVSVSAAARKNPAAAVGIVAQTTTKQGNGALKKKAPPNTAKALPRESQKELGKSSEKTTKEHHPTQKSHPARGTATIVCGCFGGIHKALTNCLYCGRISCSKEGYGFCPFCGMLVEKVEPPEEGEQDDAWLHKERLLRYDRDFARRTVILDDQADYYSNSATAWLTEEEKESAKDQEEKREKDLHQRKKQTLDIVF